MSAAGAKISAATAASIYDTTGNVLDTAPVTIQDDDSNPPSILNLDPPNDAVNVNLDGNLTFTLSDNESGIDWSTFDIVITGDQGYSKHYTDLDTAIVSRTGTPSSYNIAVDPDTDFAGHELVTVTVSTDDLIGNSLAMPAWSFTSVTIGDADPPAPRDLGGERALGRLR